MHYDKRFYRYWGDRLPRELALEQVGWERNQRIIRGRKAGLTLKKLAEFNRLSVERVRQIIVWSSEGPSPVEEYFESYRADLMDLWLTGRLTNLSRAAQDQQRPELVADRVAGDRS